jgi:hypothetical protein
MAVKAVQNHSEIFLFRRQTLFFGRLSSTKERLLWPKLKNVWSDAEENEVVARTNEFGSGARLFHDR